MVIQLEDLNITATIVEIILFNVNGTTAKPNPNISVEECVSNETYFLNMCPSLEAQQLKAKLLRVETKTKPCDLCKLGINRLLEIKYDQLEHCLQTVSTNDTVKMFNTLPDA